MGEFNYGTRDEHAWYVHKFKGLFLFRTFIVRTFYVRTHHIRQDVVETHGAADGQDDGLVGVVYEQDEARRNGGVSVVGWRGLRKKNIQVQNPQPLERT